MSYTKCLLPAENVMLGTKRSPPKVSVTAYNQLEVMLHKLLTHDLNATTMLCRKVRTVRHQQVITALPCPLRQLLLPAVCHLNPCTGQSVILTQHTMHNIRTALLHVKPVHVVVSP